MTEVFIQQVLILLSAAVIIVALFSRLRIPPIIGYMMVGVLLGPNVMGWVNDSEITRYLGEIGVAFLLFTIGLDFSVRQFLKMRNTLLLLGGGQVLLGTLSGGLIAWWIGIPWQASVIVGGALSMSSTAIAIKQLSEQLELQTRHGRLAVGILLFQDLAAILFLILIPIFGNMESRGLFAQLSITLVNGIMAVVIILSLGYWAVRPLFREISAAKIPELFTITVLMVSLAAAWMTHFLGLSYVLGAFLAGMMLSETEYRHQIEADIRPFRDILLGLFFITVGMQLNPSLLPDYWFWICLLVLGAILGKALLITLLARLAHNDIATSLRTGFVLGQSGEFGIALLTVAGIAGVMDPENSQPILAAMMVSMLLAPFFIRYSEKISDKILYRSRRDKGRHSSTEIADSASDLNNHVIICGFGETGTKIADSLAANEIISLSLDIEPKRIREAWALNYNAFYGDAAHRDILTAAGLDHARAVIVSFNDFSSSIRVVRSIRSINTEILLLVRAKNRSDLDKLIEAGANSGVTETLESSHVLTMKLLHNEQDVP